MVKSENTTLIRYEFDAYIYVLDNSAKYRVFDILLTQNDLILSKINEIKWLRVEKIEIVDLEKIGNKPVIDTKKRICGTFQSKPLYWTYAKIIVNDDTNNKHFDAITKMPRSPVVPVIFNINIKEN